MKELNFIKYQTYLTSLLIYKYIVTYFECNADILNGVWNNME